MSRQTLSSVDFLSAARRPHAITVAYGEGPTRLVGVDAFFFFSGSLNLDFVTANGFLALTPNERLRAAARGAAIHPGGGNSSDTFHVPASARHCRCCGKGRVAASESCFREARCAPRPCPGPARDHSARYWPRMVAPPKRLRASSFLRREASPTPPPTRMAISATRCANSRTPRKKQHGICARRAPHPPIRRRTTISARCCADRGETGRRRRLLREALSLRPGFAQAHGQPWPTALRRGTRCGSLGPFFVALRLQGRAYDAFCSRWSWRRAARTAACARPMPATRAGLLRLVTSRVARTRIDLGNGGCSTKLGSRKKRPKAILARSPLTTRIPRACPPRPRRHRYRARRLFDEAAGYLRGIAAAPYFAEADLAWRSLCANRVAL